MALQSLSLVSGYAPSQNECPLAAVSPAAVGRVAANRPSTGHPSARWSYARNAGRDLRSERTSILKFEHLFTRSRGENRSRLRVSAPPREPFPCDGLGYNPRPCAASF